jgi:hypothetical protein
MENEVKVILFGLGPELRFAGFDGIVVEGLQRLLFTFGSTMVRQSLGTPVDSGERAYGALKTL